MKQENRKQQPITEQYKDMPIVWKPIKELKPYKKNAKKHTKEQVKQIANSIQEFGFTQPVLIDKQNNVVAGHGRILGAKQAGYTQVPTLCLDDLTEEQIKAYRLADNKLNESPWDYNLLDEEITELVPDLDMSLFGFDVDMSDEELEQAMEKEIRFKAKEKHLVIVSCKSEKETIQAQKEIERLGYISNVFMYADCE